MRDGYWMNGSITRYPVVLFPNCRSAMVADQSTDILAIIIKCMNFAAVKHKNQRRKDPEKTPYVNHVIGKRLWNNV